ncbi:MAG: hypothetical protein GX879_05535 [Bacteroidales bacterium]|nr:hypothetical protein [Bacteroidales bacterium]
MKIALYISSFALLTAIFVSCFKIESLPPEPEISFKYFTLTNDVDELGNQALKGELCISFVDGDGDIGFKEISDTAMAESIKSVFVKKLKKIEESFQEVNLSVPMTYWIPFFETSGNNPSLRGDIIVHDINFYPPYETDTIKFTIYIKDRAGNKSNIVETPEFVPIDSLIN